MQIPLSTHRAAQRRRAGFTLVELSIVLVIIGLLLGGVMVGQTMVRSSELRSVLTESNALTVATNTFQAKYAALPGDMTNATTIWGKDDANCTTAPGTAAPRGTCNGNGDGHVTVGWGAGSAASRPEMFRFYQQLGLAGLLKGQYTGVHGPNGLSDFVGDLNAPLSRWHGGIYGLWYGTLTGAPVSSEPSLFALEYGHFFVLGNRSTTGHPWKPLFGALDASLLDMKGDDGRPAQGRMVSNNDTSWGGAGACTDSASATAARYLVTENPTCILLFRNAF